MGAKAFEVGTDEVLMAQLLGAMHIKYRFVFEAMPGTNEATYKAAIEGASACDKTGWVRFSSLAGLVQWLNQASR